MKNPANIVKAHSYVDHFSSITEAPTDGQLYGRKNAAWAIVPPAPIVEAPLDGNLYARQNGAWVLVLPPSTWLSAALDGAWTGALYCRMGAYGHAVQLYGTPSLVTGSLATGVWTRLAVLPNTMWPSVATGFLAPSQHTNNTPDYAYIYLDISGVISVMPSTNKVNQVLIDFTVTLN